MDVVTLLMAKRIAGWGLTTPFDQDIDFAGYKAIQPVIENYTETVVKSTDVSGAVAIDLSNGNVFEWTLSGNVTSITVSGVVASGKTHSFSLIVHQDTTARSVSWFANIQWHGAIPALDSDGATYVLTFFTTDAGATWYGVEAGVFDAS